MLVLMKFIHNPVHDVKNISLLIQAFAKKTRINASVTACHFVVSLGLLSASLHSSALAQSSEFLSPEFLAPSQSLPQDRTAINNFPPSNNQAALVQNDFLLAGSNQRLISELEIYQLASAQGALGSIPQVLRLMRAEIRARKGQIFTDADTQTYFNTRPWYNPRFNTVTLSTIETRNTAAIQSVEAKLAQGGALNLTDLSDQLLSPISSATQSGLSAPEIQNLGVVRANDQALAPASARIGNDDALKAEQSALDARITQSNQLVSLTQASLPDLSRQVTAQQSLLPPSQQALVMQPLLIEPQGITNQRTAPSATNASSTLLAQETFDFLDAEQESQNRVDNNQRVTELPSSLTTQNELPAFPALPQIPNAPLAEALADNETVRANQENAITSQSNQDILLQDNDRGLLLRAVDTETAEEDNNSNSNSLGLDLSRFKVGDRVALVRLPNNQLIAQNPAQQFSLQAQQRIRPQAARMMRPFDPRFINPVRIQPVAPRFSPYMARPAAQLNATNLLRAHYGLPYPMTLPQRLPPYAIAMPILDRQVTRLKEPARNADRINNEREISLPSAKSPVEIRNKPTLPDLTTLPTIPSTRPALQRAESTPTAISDNSAYILPFAMTRLLSEQEIIARATALSQIGNVPAVLRLARNEIAARRGRVFKSAILNNYFSRQPWYRAGQNAGDFTAIEQQNMDLILSLEQSFPGQRVYRNIPKSPITATAINNGSNLTPIQPNTARIVTVAQKPATLSQNAEGKEQIQPQELPTLDVKPLAREESFLLPQSAFELLNPQGVINKVAFLRRQEQFNANQPWQIVRLMRAEIYARSGFAFNQEDLKNYFAAQSWYRAINSPLQLSEIERANFSLLLRMERDLRANSGQTIT